MVQLGGHPITVRADEIGTSVAVIAELLDTPPHPAADDPPDARPSAASCPFSYGGLLTETALLGTVAYRAGRPLDRSGRVRSRIAARP